MYTKSIEISSQGPPSVMKWVDKHLPPPENGFVTVKHTFIGLNYIDTYHRSGLYPLPLPSGLGMEAAGIVIKTSSSSSLKEGDRVAYGLGPPGSYASSRNIQESKLIKIPNFIKDRDAAAIMLKGMTVEYLLERTFKVDSSNDVLLHAAAGGVGLIACQWLKHIGANIIGTVGNSEKAELAKRYGCAHTILYREEDFEKRVLDITEGRGVDVVYDGVGKDTSLKSINCLKPLGMLVLFGNSSGNSPAIDPSLLATRGSLFLTRPTLMTYCADRSNMKKSADRVFTMMKNSAIKPFIGKVFPLSGITKVHEELENRKTNGSIVLENDY